MKLNYFGKLAKIISEDKTHYLIRFENGTQIATAKNRFKESDKIVDNFPPQKVSKSEIIS